MAERFIAIDTITGKQKARQASLGAWSQETPSGTVNGSNTVFTLTYEPLDAGSTFVYLNSQLIPASEYSINFVNKTVTFATAPALAQNPYVVYLR